MSEIHFRICRKCGESTRDTNLLKYSTRHYIHPKCAVEKWGADIVLLETVRRRVKDAEDKACQAMNE